MSEQSGRADTLEERVTHLENELYQTQTTLHRLVVVLEMEFGKDFDGNGHVG